MPPAKPKGEYIETDTGNKVSRRAQLHGTQHVILGGRTVIQPEVCIRGDLVRPKDASSTSSSGGTTSKRDGGSQSYTSVNIGRYTFVSSGTILRPPLRMTKGIAVYTPQKIGDHVYISRNCVVEAASIGDHVHVGEGAVIGKMCIIRDHVKILDGAVLPPGMVVPSGCVVGGRPAVIVADVGDGWGMGGDGVEGGDLRELWRTTGQAHGS